MRKTSCDKQNTLKKKATDFVYLSTKTYLSISHLLTVAILPVMILHITYMLGIGNNIWGPLIFMGSISVLYALFVFFIVKGKIRNTFPLRFLVNGISLMFLTILFPGLFFSFCLIAEPNCMKILLFFIATYILFVALYLGLTVIGVHVGIYGRVRRFNNMPAVIAVNTVLSSLIPVSGAIGMWHGRELRQVLTVNEQVNALFVYGAVLAFILSLGHVNFVQYYYCIKYSILCDENGDTTSPKLIPAKKAELTKDISADLEKEQPEKKPQSLLKTIVKAILILLAIPVAVVILTVVAAVIYTFINHI